MTEPRTNNISIQILFQAYSHLNEVVKFYKHKAKMFALERKTYEGNEINVIHLNMDNYKTVNKRTVVVTAGLEY